MTSFKLSADSKVRIETMVRTNDGFQISETDLQLRGPGDLLGTQQSGVLDLLIADLGRDGKLLQTARETAIRVLEDDPNLEKIANSAIRGQIEATKKSSINWSRIS
jgi:ATP-dependent DNA helicase RecG